MKKNEEQIQGSILHRIQIATGQCNPDEFICPMCNRKLPIGEMNVYDYKVHDNSYLKGNHIVIESHKTQSSLCKKCDEKLWEHRMLAKFLTFLSLGIMWLIVYISGPDRWYSVILGIYLLFAFINIVIFRVDGYYKLTAKIFRLHWDVPGRYY